MSAARWVFLTNLDPEGLGGVETYMRSLRRELGRLGVRVEFRSPAASPRMRDAGTAVAHLQGSDVRIFRILALRLRGRRPIIVLTLHGETLGRMRACGEWAWPGGHLAAARELAGVLCADVVVAVREGLLLSKVARLLGKRAVVIPTAWDSWAGSDAREAPVPLPAQGTGPVVFIGRSSDPVYKGVDRFRQVVRRLRAVHSDLVTVAAPGDGFEDEPGILRTGRLDAEGVRALLERSRVFVLSSRYEGNPIVVLEALGMGVPVVTTPVGDWRRLASLELEGFFPARPGDVSSLQDAIERALSMPADAASRRARQEVNRARLDSWADVARRTRDAVLSDGA